MQIMAMKIANTDNEYDENDNDDLCSKIWQARFTFEVCGIEEGDMRVSRAQAFNLGTS